MGAIICRPARAQDIGPASALASWNRRARSAASDLVAPVRMPMRTPHVWIAAMSGLHAEDVHDAREFVGEHVQGHPGGNLRHGSNSRRITPSGCSELIDETNLCISQRERDRQGP